MRKKGSKNKVYSAEFKIGVIIDMREHKLGYNETIRKYWNDGLVSNHFQQIDKQIIVTKNKSCGSHAQIIC